MDIKLTEPSATLSINLNQEEFARLLEKGRVTLDIHKYCLSGYIQFIHINRGEKR